MNNIARQYHQVAMDLYDFGKIYKAKGQPKYYKGNLELAFLLDKEAAIKVQSESTEVLWKAVYPRSAGWLALQCGKYAEAQQLAELGLSHQTHISDYEVEKLSELLQKANKKLKENPHKSTKVQSPNSILAIASATNIDQYLRIEQFKNNTTQFLKIIPADSLQITRSFLGDMVEIEIKTGEDGELILKNIRKAA